MSNELAVMNSDDPRSVVKRGTDQANALMEIVAQAEGISVNISGRKYLRFEAWQTIGRFNRASPMTAWSRAIYDGTMVDGLPTIIGYEARVTVVGLDNGETVSAAEAMCGMDEFVTRGQQTAMAKQNAARSMAQTRAAAKALRMAYSFVAVLGGFEATPAEEMNRDERPEAPARQAAQQPATRRRPSPRTRPPEGQEEAPESSDAPNWTAFWPAVREMGYETARVWPSLNVESADEWFASGKTLEDALEDLTALKG